MSITLLRTLVAVADRGSFAGAADQVCVTHAAVGQQMKRLEAQLRVELFDRSQKSPQLNATGWALIPNARGVLHAYDTMLEGVVGEARLYGELSLGAMPSTIGGLVPQSIKRLIRTFPDLHIRVVPGLADDLIEQVERGGLDTAILSVPDSIPPQLTWHLVAKEPLVLITAPDIHESDPVEILQSQPFIRHARQTAAGKLVDQWLSEKKIVVRPTMEMDSLETLANMVSYNLGVSVVPNLCVPDPTFERLRKIPLGPQAPLRELGLLTRTDSPKTKLIERLLEEVRQTSSQAPHVPAPIAE
jgi:DNA-binding transcriptional LysR family regulator